MRAQEQMVECIRAEMEAANITQAELARRIGRTPKHVNQVLHGKCGGMDLDYWLFVLGHEFVVQTRPLTERYQQGSDAS